ncbi:hypothetical protein GUJ93_ZPchr0005g15935 [Zizania palustris]|uniref:Uncharacterized protein n=1 Tax=Zizania palustris TaxID=103762 RepID=A0A8J5S1Y4_ZIZPA|nr:hypothetical protein GUJ93_ZPchr0005g15935 [Zizania palustris]
MPACLLRLPAPPSPRVSRPRRPASVSASPHRRACSAFISLRRLPTSPPPLCAGRPCHTLATRAAPYPPPRASSASTSPSKLHRKISPHHHVAAIRGRALGSGFEALSHRIFFPL